MLQYSILINHWYFIKHQGTELVPDVRFDGPLELLTLRPRPPPPDVQHDKERGAAWLFEKRIQIDEGRDDDGHRKAHGDTGPLHGAAGRRRVGPARYLDRDGGERPPTGRLVQSAGEELPGRRADARHRSGPRSGRVFPVRVGDIRRPFEAERDPGSAEDENGKDGAGLREEAERHHNQSVGDR